MEQEIVNSCIEYLNHTGFVVWRQNSGAFKVDNHFYRFSYRKGISDIIGWHKGSGRFIAVECKFGKNKLSLDQENFIKELTNHGGIAIVAYSLDDLINSLAKYGYTNPTRSYK